MARRQRQLDELDRLCRAGRVAHAVDLAFDHVARFGDGHEVVALLAGALEHVPVTHDVRRRFAELVAATASTDTRASVGREGSAVPSTHAHLAARRAGGAR